MTPYDDALAYAIAQESSANQSVQEMQPTIDAASAELATLQAQQSMFQTDAANWASTATVLQEAVNSYVP